MALGPVNSFLVPDISGDGTTSQSILAAARAVADGMSGGEVLLRAAAEIGGTWLLAWAIKAAIARLGEAALKVSTSCCAGHCLLWDPPLTCFACM